EVPASRQVELAPAAAAQPQLADTAAKTASPTDELGAADAPPPAATVDAPPVPTPAPAPKPARTAAPKPARAPSSAPVSSASASAPAKAPAPAAPTTGTIAGGASLSLAMGSRICTNTHRAGDRATATLASSVSGTNGAVIPAGAAVTLQVTESARGENGKEGVRLAFEPISVTFGGETYSVGGRASVAGLETVRSQTTGDQAKKVAVGAAVGALAGQLLGKKTKSTVAGAAVGAAAGGVIAAGSADWNGCVAEGGTVTVTLFGPVTVRLAP
ncbi:MAG: hypothetical protein P3B98_13675, partial [Gemmatimonadota bacterium]|nr:hypothetical protein [Gemmatimonadota bacterium]